MKKRYLSMLLAVLMLLSLTVTAFAEESQDEVSAAAATDSISLVSIDSVSYNSIQYTINLNVTDSLARQEYFLGMEYSSSTDFQHGIGKYFSTDFDPTLLNTAYDNDSRTISRTSVCFVPNVTYYLRPVMYSSDRSLVFRSANLIPFSGPKDDSQYTSLALYEEYSADRGWLYGKFVAPADGMYALTSGHNYDFITWIKAGATSSGSVGSNGSSDPLTLFFDASAGETVYLFGYSPNFSSSECIRVVRAEEVAPSANSIEVGDAFDITNMAAKFPFTISTTPTTAQNGYQVGIIFGDHGTDPSTWEITGRIYQPEYTIKSSTQMTYGSSSICVPGLDIDYQAALLDLNSDAILARGNYVGHLVASNDISNMTPLTAGSEFTWTDRTKVLYFAVPQSGMYQIHGENMGRFKVLNQKAKTFCDTGDQSEYNCSIYAKMGETLYIYTGKPNDNLCSITISYNGRIADTQQLQAAINAGETDLDLDNYGSFEITDDVTVPSGTTLSFEGTELVIAPNVTLEIQGTSRGDRISNSGTLRISGNSASFRTAECLTMTPTGHMEVDGNGFVEIVSNSTSNNEYLNPNMDMRFTNGGSVTFGYFIPSEEYMRSLLAGLDSSNPNIRLDFQIYADLTLSSDLTLRDNVSLHTDMNWNQGGSFTIPAGVTLTIPQSSGFYAYSSAINIEGSLVNSGAVVLSSVGNVENYPHILPMTLQSGGSYSGNGQVIIETLDNPTLYLLGFDAFAINEEWRNELGNNVSYRLISKTELAEAFDAFKTACESQNPPENYDALQSLGQFTISESLTIPAGMQVDAWGTTFVIPDGVNLTVNGGLNCRGFDIAEGGALLVTGLTDSNWAHANADRITCAGSITVGDWASFSLNINGWNESVANNTTVSGNGYFSLDIYANNEAAYLNGVEAVKSFNPYDASFRFTINMSINYPCVLQDNTRFDGLVMYHVHNDQHSNGSLTVPEDATVTVTGNGYVSLQGSCLNVYGTLQNQGTIELNTVYESGETGSLVIADGGSYSGSGRISVYDGENPKSHILGVSEGRIMQTGKDEQIGWSEYRILANDPNPITDGSSFSITTANEGVFYYEYSAGYVMMPDADGLYSFTLSFDPGTALHWNDARLGINGTDLQNQSFDTDEPESLTFLARMTANEPYELVFSNNEELGALTVNVSVTRLADGFAEMLNAMAANPHQHFEVAVTASDLDGLTTLTVPHNVTMNVDSAVTIPSGLSVTCYGTFYVNRNGAFVIPSGAHVDLAYDEESGYSGSVLMEGGTLDAAVNSMSFAGRSVVQISNRNYDSNEAAVNAVTGIQKDKIHLEATTRSQEEYDYWYGLAAGEGYRSLNLCLENGLAITLTQSLPEEYCIVVNQVTGVTIPENADILLNGFIAMEGGSFTNNGTLTVSEVAGIGIWDPNSTVINNGRVQLYGSIQGSEEAWIRNLGDVVIMDRNANITNVRFDYNLYHYPEEHRLVLPASLTAIEEEAFANVSAWEIVLPETVGSIGNRAFADSDDLLLVVIPKWDAEITGNPFENSPNAGIASPISGSVQSFADTAGIPFVSLNR